MTRIKLKAMLREAYQTKVTMPATLLDRMDEAAKREGGDRHRSAWVAEALKMFLMVPADQRNEMLLSDALITDGMSSCAIRYSKDMQISVRDILVAFRTEHPAVEMDTSAVVRHAVIYRLRNETAVQI